MKRFIFTSKQGNATCYLIHDGDIPGQLDTISGQIPVYIDGDEFDKHEKAIRDYIKTLSFDVQILKAPDNAISLEEFYSWDT